MRSLFIALTIFVSFQALAESQPPAVVKQLASQFKVAMVDCPERIWTDFSWKNTQILFVYPSQTDSWFWDVNSNSFKSTPTAQLQPYLLSTTYEFLNIGGKETLTLNMGDEAYELFELGIHEFFHYLGQRNWMGGGGGRSTVYPIQWQPRFYRKMIHQHLINYLAKSNSLELRKAKYWYDKWIKEYPQENLSTTDGYEGTAAYVELIARAIVETPKKCESSEVELKESIVKTFNKSQYARIFDGSYLKLDSEGYSIGSLAAVILRIEGRNLSTWNLAMKAARTPLEELMDFVQPAAEATSSTDLNIFKNAAKNLNEQMAPVLEPQIANWNDPSFVRVEFKVEWVGNFSPEYFISVPSIQKTVSPFIGDYEFKRPGWNYTFKDGVVIFMLDYYEDICPSASMFALVPRSQIQIFGDGGAEVKSDKVVGQMPGRLTTDKNGFQYFCN